MAETVIYNYHAATMLLAQHNPGLALAISGRTRGYLDDTLAEQI